MATHSSILAWKMPWTEEPGGLPQTMGSQRVGHNTKQQPHTHKKKKKEKKKKNQQPQTYIKSRSSLFFKSHNTCGWTGILTVCFPSQAGTGGRLQGNESSDWRSPLPRPPSATRRECPDKRPPGLAGLLGISVWMTCQCRAEQGPSRWQAASGRARPCLGSPAPHLPGGDGWKPTLYIPRSGGAGGRSALPGRD